MLRTILSLALTFAVTSAYADDRSERIEKVVDSFSQFAQSGVHVYKVKPARTVKAMVLELAIQIGNAEDESDLGWVENENDAWEADSSNWAETEMKTAYEYMTTFDEYYLEQLNEPGQEAEKARVMAEMKKAKEDFKLFLNSGVKFGVGPMGAVQCGVTFAALLIIDPATGKIYSFAKEGSGC